jgi:hypothetical protein
MTETGTPERPQPDAEELAPEEGTQSPPSPESDDVEDGE